MRKVLTIASAAVLAAASSLAPVSISPAQADSYGTAFRGYLGFSWGGSPAADESANLGFQVNKQTIELDSRAVPKFGDVTVLDFALGRDGLDKAAIMGIDAIEIYQMWSEQDQAGFGGWHDGKHWPFFLGGLAITLGALCLADVICDDDDDSNAGKLGKPDDTCPDYVATLPGLVQPCITFD